MKGIRTVCKTSKCGKYLISYIYIWPHLHRVRHAVVIIAFINLGEKVLTQLKTNKQTNTQIRIVLFEFPLAQCCIIHYQRYDPLLVFLLPPHHGVAFACSCLTICKYAHIVSLEGVKQHLFSDVLVHLHLGRIVDVLGLREKEKVPR